MTASFSAPKIGQRERERGKNNEKQIFLYIDLLFFSHVKDNIGFMSYETFTKILLKTLICTIYVALVHLSMPMNSTLFLDG